MCVSFSWCELCFSCDWNHRIWLMFNLILLSGVVVLWLVTVILYSMCTIFHEKPMAYKWTFAKRNKRYVECLIRMWWMRYAIILWRNFIALQMPICTMTGDMFGNSENFPNAMAIVLAIALCSLFAENLLWFQWTWIPFDASTNSDKSPSYDCTYSWSLSEMAKLHTFTQM